MERVLTRNPESPSSVGHSCLNVSRTCCLVQAAADLLVGKGEMLTEYFGIGISDDGYVTSLPILLDGHAPDLLRLPAFLLTLANDVRSASVLMYSPSCVSSSPTAQTLGQEAGTLGPASMPRG